jgi:hypothetical protein
MDIAAETTRGEVIVTTGDNEPRYRPPIATGILSILTPARTDGAPAPDCRSCGRPASAPEHVAFRAIHILWCVPGCCHREPALAQRDDGRRPPRCRGRCAHRVRGTPLVHAACRTTNGLRATLTGLMPNRGRETPTTRRGCFAAHQPAWPTWLPSGSRGRRRICSKAFEAPSTFTQPARTTPADPAAHAAHRPCGS